MDIGKRQSVLSFAGGALSIRRLRDDEKMVKVLKKRKKKKQKKKSPPASEGDGAAVEPSTNAVEVTPAAKPPKPRKRKASSPPANDAMESSVSASVIRRRRRKFKKKKRKSLIMVKEEPSTSLGGGSSGGENKKSRSQVKKVAKSVKMSRITEENTPEILTMEGGLVPTNTTLEAETINLNARNKTIGLDGWMEEQIQEMLRTDDKGMYRLETAHFVDKFRENLPTITRAEEEAWMVGVSPRSRNVCQNGARCESILMCRAKGIDPLIYLPCVEKEGFGPFNQCILCLRGTATRGILKTRMDDVCMIKEACFQTYVNLVNLNGQYRKEHTLPIRRDKYEGIVGPIVAHFYSGYNAKSYVKADGTEVRFWSQDGYTLPDVVPYSSSSSSMSSSSVTGGDAASTGDTNSSSFLLNAPRAAAMH